jgi:hypothetical protein
LEDPHRRPNLDEASRCPGPYGRAPRRRRVLLRRGRIRPLAGALSIVRAARRRRVRPGSPLLPRSSVPIARHRFCPPVRSPKGAGGVRLARSAGTMMEPNGALQEPSNRLVEPKRRALLFGHRAPPRVHFFFPSCVGTPRGPRGSSRAAKAGRVGFVNSVVRDSQGNPEPVVSGVFGAAYHCRGQRRAVRARA